MAKVKVHIWYTNDGRIAAIGHSCPRYRVSAIAHKGHFVFETEIDEQLIEQFYQIYKVNLLNLSRSEVY
ncbi:hypothetical protein Sta7437_3061 [Stanieria cyanosphaera PCC 7437]|uniref:Uncharacterized protein n=1 Tax=Stanieria cyanosphaera (strain ATCC 29371 / PCC 7437) TaxID=111780 RepID=K9XVF9_STAC7|nr:hypothetical protein [Stanieria cyanosphaera]AFZ36575.1 hypothetical protein Sta7437_3061 [Stanieria cyanosphaera PCC 7437]